MWQIKGLRADFADLWQIQDLAAFLQIVEECAGEFRRTRAAKGICQYLLYYNIKFCQGNYKWFVYREIATEKRAILGQDEAVL